MFLLTKFLLPVEILVWYFLYRRTSQIRLLHLFSLGMKTAYSCGATDTEQRTQFASSGYFPKWSEAETDEMKLLNKVFFLRTKIIVIAS